MAFTELIVISSFFFKSISLQLRLLGMFRVFSLIIVFSHLQFDIILMDKLKLLLESKKPQTKTTEHKDIIAKQKENLINRQIEEKQQQLEQSAKRLKELEEYYDYDIRRKKVKVEQTVEELPLKPEEVKAKLRQFHQPITLFGETQLARYKRFKTIEEFHLQNPTYDMKNYDEEFQEKVKENQQFLELEAKYRNRLIEPRLGDDSTYLEKKRSMILNEKNYPFESICDEVYLWIRHVIRDWSAALEQKYNSQQKRAKGTPSYSRLAQTVSDIRGFFFVLKKRGGDKDMITSVYHIMNCCLVRQYTQANDKYIDLSIGNAPWPMGVAMLGITVKRNATKVSHVLTDEMTRKWMQSIKRLISVSQQLYPNEDRMKMVGYSVNLII